MNVLVCAACGRSLSEPLRLLPELPERPEYDGLKNADGSRHAPSTVPRGACAVDPEPSGAPLVPHPDPEWLGPAMPGVIISDPDGPGCLISAGPRNTLVVHPEDARGFLAPNPAVQEIGCCGAPGQEGPNQVCPGCGAEVATLFSECYGSYETHFLPDAVRVAAP
ncbi:hypothetical protein GCM10022403_059680 [Streptomyces coacervatus]|uniref:Uncharacterized protein n=1 Tax=Streptomyces coacervatus TaxID=647381 RepID=A0ABP7IHD9_9ACTN|nr:hypothetical protein [Streptomyces coacervatus]MDF2269770.1 hypothetical protein [Streptomyces coacervatus]